MEQSQARFIVGTGRCGSTILSRMIDLHPDVAVLSEFFITLHFTDKFGERELDGAELVGILDCGLASTGDLKKIVAHLATPEIVFEGGATSLPDDASAYRDGVFPEMILIPLAHLFDEPAPVFDELLVFAREQPRRPLSAHYRTLFAWLTRRAGKTLWIERSGGSIACLPELVELFPDAKYLHLHRNPLDAALSMQRHNHFRLRAFKHYDLATVEGIRWSDLDETDLTNDMPMSPKLKAIFDHPVPLEYFLRDWSDTILRGMPALKQLAPAQYQEVRFEDLMGAPADSLGRIADFFDLRWDEAWIESACALLNPGQAAHATPGAEQQALLERYCHDVMVLLGRAPAVALYT